MRLKELKSMPILKATPAMFRLAMSDKPNDTARNYEYYKKYSHWMHIRCCVKNGIIKISCFYTEDLRMGATLSRYDIYCDFKNKKYITYSRKKDKWLTASLYRLDWPSYYLTLEKVYTSRETKKRIRSYFNCEIGGLEAVDNFQKEIMEENLKMRHKKETDPWDEDLKGIPDIPKPFNHWANKEAIPEQFIFYKYSRKKNKTGYCTYCEKEVPIENPRYNAEGICPCCKRKITYKSLGMVGTFATADYPMYLLQKFKDGLIVRRFWAWRLYRKGKSLEPEFHIGEYRRIICDENAYPQRAYYFGDYKQCETRWIANDVSEGIFQSRSGKIYPYNLPSLSKSILKHTGLYEYCKKEDKTNPEGYLYKLQRKPYIEKMVKVGLFTLANEHLGITYGSFYIANIASKERSLTKTLCIDKQELKRLRRYDGGTDFLVWLQYEKSTNKEISDNIIKWLCKHKLEPKNFKFIRHKMTVMQTAEYLKKQWKLSNMNYRDILTTWKDYLAMAKSLGIDTDLEIIYKPRNLKQKHDEMVKQCHEGKDIAVAAGEILEKFPNVSNIITSIKGKYEYSEEKYIIVQPNSITDILIESRTLQHCGDNERYFDRIARQESYIMFLRKASIPDKAFYTLEVEPNGTIRQCRSVLNEMYNDIKKAESFLRRWQSVIAKRLSDEDRELAKKSKILRLQEFAELRESNAIIRTGSHRGALLVDVLMNDLMEVA